MASIETRSLVMLVVEDNAGDVAFLREAVAASNTDAAMRVVNDGCDAMRFLRREAAFADAPRPDVIVLDLNLPIKSGHEVLLEIASDPDLNTIPVAVLTSSIYETCVCDKYPKGRCLYFTKTADFKRLQEIVRQIETHARKAG
jgi:two-component system response regulator